MLNEFPLGSEYKRKAVHIGSSAFALLLRWLNFWQAGLCALAALLFNTLILPRMGGKNLYRDDDVRRGYPVGILLYPISVLVMISLFPDRLYIVAAAWGIMAWGDGFASIFGRKYGRAKLPWNADRSYAGSLAFLIFGSLSAVFFTAWVWKDAAEPKFWYVVAIPILATVLAAVVETIPMGLNDNLTVPLSASIFMFALHQIDPALLSVRQDQLLQNLLWGAAVNVFIGGTAYALRLVSLSGFIGGFIVGTFTFLGGYPLYIILIVFFFLGSGATKFGYARKKSLGVAQEKGGARGWKNAVANCSVGALLSLLSILAPDPIRSILLAGFFGALATAAADTVSSEIGQVLGKHPILITTLRPVPVGTEGAVSLEGTFAGIVASIVLCVVGVTLNMLTGTSAILCVIAAFIGTTVESYLGATLETLKLIDNEIINFMNTLVGAAAAMVLVAIFV